VLQCAVLFVESRQTPSALASIVDTRVSPREVFSSAHPPTPSFTDLQVPLLKPRIRMDITIHTPYRRTRCTPLLSTTLLSHHVHLPLLSRLRFVSRTYHVPITPSTFITPPIFLSHMFVFLPPASHSSLLHTRSLHCHHPRQQHHPMASNSLDRHPWRPPSPSPHFPIARETSLIPYINVIHTPLTCFATTCISAIRISIACIPLPVSPFPVSLSPALYYLFSITCSSTTCIPHPPDHMIVY